MLGYKKTTYHLESSWKVSDKLYLRHQHEYVYIYDRILLALASSQPLALYYSHKDI